MKLADQQVIQAGSQGNLGRLAVVLDNQTEVDNLGSVGDKLGFLGIHTVLVWLGNLCVDLEINVKYYS
jgi:hypothetical protein